MTGRPTKYRAEYCGMLVEHMKKGLSFESFGAIVNVCKDTLYEWAKRHTRFSDAKSLGEVHSRLFWEKMAINASLGLIPNSANSVLIFALKNRLKWRNEPIGEETEKGFEPMVIEMPIAGKQIQIGKK